MRRGDSSLIRKLLPFVAAAAGVCAGVAPGRTAGTTAAPFLGLGVSARAIAMGEAQSAVAEGPDALYWNPAGLGRLRSPALSFMHASYLQGIFYDYAAYDHPLARQGTLGASVQYFSSAEFDQLDAAGNPAGSLRLSDLALTLGYGQTLRPRLLRNVSLGAGVKFVRSSIVDSAQTGALDLGGLWAPSDRFRAGIALQNLFGKLKFHDEADSLPLNFKLGTALLPARDWLFAFDFNVPQGETPYAGVGGEYCRRLDGSLWGAGRLGYNSRTAGSIDGFSGMSLGFGAGWKRASLDFAWAPFGDLGNAYRVSLGYDFGGTESQDARSQNAEAKKTKYAGTPRPDAPAVASRKETREQPRPEAPAETEAFAPASQPKPQAEEVRKTPEPAAPARLSPKNEEARREVRHRRKKSLASRRTSSRPLLGVGIPAPEREAPKEVAELPPAAAGGAEVPYWAHLLQQDYDRATRLMERRRLTQAIAVWRGLLEKDPNYQDAGKKLAECLTARGIVYYRKRDYLKAIADFEEALKLTPDDPFLKKFLADARFMYRDGTRKP